MSTTKTAELFDILRAACARQFGFNPRRISAGMRYVGKEGHGRDVVHVFRDAATHSQIALKNTFATLREKQGEKPHWTEAEKAYYKSSNAVIDAEIAAKQAELDFIRNSALYRDHREQLLSHYSDWPSFQPDGPHPGEAARLLIQTLAEAKDARLAEFIEHTHVHDVEQLAHLLLAPCHLEVEDSKGTGPDILR